MQPRVALMVRIAAAGWFLTETDAAELLALGLGGLPVLVRRDDGRQRCALRDLSAVVAVLAAGTLRDVSTWPSELAAALRAARLPTTATLVAVLAAEQGVS